MYGKKRKKSYAMALIGDIIKGHTYSRDLKSAIICFVHSAKKNCPLSYFYLGKEFFYGRCLDQNYDKAKKFLLKAIKDDAEPRAGYYLFKIPGIRKDENIDDVELLKTGVNYGHKRAIYLYGKLLYTGKDEKIPKDVEKGIFYLQQSVDLKYKKALKFCKNHGIKVKGVDLSEKEKDSDFYSTQSHNRSSESVDEESTFDFIVPREKMQKNCLTDSDEYDSIMSFLFDNDNESNNESAESSNDKNENKNSESSSDIDNDISILNAYWL